MTTIPAPSRKPRPYRDFLTPAWHRKFTAAAALTMTACYVDAVLMADWHSIWSFFPFSTGITCLLLFISALPIFVIRVAATHVGSRTIPSPFESFYRVAKKFSNVQVFAWYIFSGWFYSEVYRWTRDADARLGYVEPGRGRDKGGFRLNERGLLFSFLLASFGIGQSIWHLFTDMDKAPLPTKTTASEPNQGQGDGQSSNKVTAIPDVKPPWNQLLETAPKLVTTAAVKTVIFSIANAIFYYVLFRNPIKHVAYSFFGNLYRIPDTFTYYSIVPAIPLMSRVVMQGFLVFLTWDFANAAYNAHVSQEPLKNEKPLTDASNDPNGSLLVGLKSKKAFAKANAFWELAIITQRFVLRRATIFSELEREGGSTWSQILKICLEEIADIQTRIEATKPKEPGTPVSKDIADAAQEKPIVPPLKRDNVLASTPPPKTVRGKALQLASGVLKGAGEHPEEGLTPLKGAVATGEWAVDHAGRQIRRIPGVKSAEQRAQALIPTRAKATGTMNRFLSTPVIGPLFQTTFVRRATAVICGSPLSRTTFLVTAISAITNLAVFSLTEDTFGSVSKDVPSIIRVFTKTLSAIDAYLRTLSPHWTDVNFVEQDRFKVEEVNAVRDALRSGLRDILGAFGEFATSMGLSEKEVREAKVLAGAQEMTAAEKMMAT